MSVPISFVAELLAVMLVRMFEVRTAPGVWDLLPTSIHPSVWLAGIVLLGNVVIWRWYRADAYRITPRTFALGATLLYLALVLLIVVYRISNIPMSGS